MVDAIIPLNGDVDGLETSVRHFISRRSVDLSGMRVQECLLACFTIEGLSNGPTPHILGTCGTFFLIALWTRSRGQQSLPGSCPEFLKFVLSECRCFGDISSKGIVSRGRHHQTRKSQQGNGENDQSDHHF